MSVNASPSGSGSSGSGGNNNSGGGSSPCGACKFLRRKCVTGCIFAPYFDSEQGATNFAAVHKVFGASNVSKMLLNIPIQKRHDAVGTICYEAQSRLRDPVYGCVSHIYALHQQVVSLQAELSYIQGHLAPVELPHPAPPQVTMGSPPPRAFLPTNIPANTFSSMQGIYDLSSLYDPIVQTVWAPEHQPPIDPPEYVRSGPSPIVVSGKDGGSDNNKGDFQAFAQELLHRDASPSEVPLPCPNAPSPNASSAPSLSK